MLNRRTFLGGISASLPILAAPGSLHAQGTAPRLHAMIVGINNYTGRDGHGRQVPQLKGCQNDAADIERQVKRFKPATLVRLGWQPATATEAAKEVAVTRADFLRAWEQTLAAARSGDRLLLTFAGHGSRVPVLPGNPSGELDGFDDTLVLTGWDARQGRNGEHIIDDELSERFEAANAKGVIVCFVADSCHSGTLTRSVDPLAGDKTYRFTTPAPATARELPAPGTQPPLLPPNMVFIAGAQEHQTVPEILAPGTQDYRGALSLAFAQALAGGAVVDGAITVRNLLLFVRRNARLLSEGVQDPTRRPTRVTLYSVSDQTQLFVLTADAPPAPPAGQTVAMRLRVHGRSPADAERIVRGLRGVALARPGEAEALVWDAERRLILNSQGHSIADNVGEGDLQGVVDCRLALNHLVRLAANGLDVQVLIDGRDTPASDATHKPGDRLVVKVSGLANGDYLAVFNLAGNGTVEMLDPTPYHASNPNRADFTRPHFNTGRPFSSSEVSLPDVHVGAPFGADHVIAVAGARPLNRLMPALVTAHRQHDIPGVMAALASEREAQPLKIGLRGIYTWRR